jgi:hypothetical protein
MRVQRKAVVMITAVLLVLPLIAEATPLKPALDLQAPGLTLASAGVGLIGLGSGSRNLTLNIQGTVQFARLYWVGRQAPCDQDGGGNCAATTSPYRDQQIVFDGHPLTGTIVGTESQPTSSQGPIFNLAYFADVTNIVAAKGTGSQSFSFVDGDISNNLWRLDGAGLIVGYIDAANPNTYRVLIDDGLDFAYGRDPVAGDTQVTAPVTLNHGMNTSTRSADLTLFVGDCTAPRPDRIDVSNNPSVLNSLDSSEGSMFDNQHVPISIPAGVGGTTVQLVSADNAESTDHNPDSMLWALAALRVQQLDTGKPICVLAATRTGPPAQIDIKVQDTGTGLASVVVTKSNNADTPVPPFTVGTTDPLIITATKIDQTKSAQVELQASDLAGNTVTCDPILALLVREPGKQEVQTFTDVPGAEHVLTVFNGSPGVATIELWVNGRKVKIKGLSDGETATFDLGSAMKAQGGNTISAKVGGRPGSSANIMLWDGNQ